jgi:glucokinase
MSQSPVVLGLDFGGTKIAVAVCDMSGGLLGSVALVSGPDSPAASSLERAMAASHSLLQDVAAERPLGAVSAATFGIPYDDRVDLAPNIPGWDEVQFGAELRAAFPGVPLAMATDVKAAATAEARWGALSGCDPGIYLNLGTGVAAAIVSGGSVIRGAHGAAGEIGYNLRSTADVGLPLEQRVTFEDVTSGRGLMAVADGALQQRLTAAAIFELAETDPVADRIVSAFLDELSHHVVNLAIAVDPARIAVGGGMVRSWARIGPALRRALDAGVPFAPQLVLSHFPYDAPLIGALALGVQAARSTSGEGAVA